MKGRPFEDISEEKHKLIQIADCRLQIAAQNLAATGYDWSSCSLAGVQFFNPLVACKRVSKQARHNPKASAGQGRTHCTAGSVQNTGGSGGTLRNPYYCRFTGRSNFPFCETTGNNCRLTCSTRTVCPNPTTNAKFHRRRPGVRWRRLPAAQESGVRFHVGDMMPYICQSHQKRMKFAPCNGCVKLKM